jgi:hypothetical protein
MTYYLRFADKDAWETAASNAGFRTKTSAPSQNNPEELERQWTWLYYTHEWAIDDVGILYDNDAVIDPETFELITPPTPMEGWHVNFIGMLPEGWDQYLVAPRNPRRMFA